MQRALRVVAPSSRHAAPLLRAAEESRRHTGAASQAHAAKPVRFEADGGAAVQLLANVALVGLAAWKARDFLKTPSKVAEDEQEDVDDARLQASTIRTPSALRSGAKAKASVPSSAAAAPLAPGLGPQKASALKGKGKELVELRAATWKAVGDLPRIKELDYVPKGQYREVAIEKSLYPLIEDNQVLVVAGGFFGDEGKGKTVDAIARHKKVKVVARVNSGENAGHTVFGPTGIKYHFHLCPSGLLTPGKVNCVGPECVMDPVSFMAREISQLQRDGVAYKDRLFIGNCHLVCPHHKLLDLMGSWSRPNASTLQGMAPVHASKAKRQGIRMDHLFNDREAARRRLELDMNSYWGAIKHLGIDEKKLYEVASQNPKIPKHVVDFILAEDKARYVLDLFDECVVTNPEFPPRADVSHLLRTTVEHGDKVLLEGPQSYWLSNAAEKFWDSGTSANTCAAGMLAASRLNLQGLKVATINVHKTPGSSRVGAGACPTSFVPQNFFSETGATATDFEDMKLDWRDVSKKYFQSVQSNGLVKPAVYTNEVGTYDLGAAMAAATCVHPAHREFGVTTGKPRVVGFFDCVAHAEMMAAQGPYCSIGALDRGDDYDEYGVCIAYIFHHPEGKSMVSNGRVFESGTIIRPGEALPTQAILAYCQPIVKTISGWRDTPIFARGSWWENRPKPAVLPKTVCELLDIIEHFTGCKIISIGNGPMGEDIIYIERTS